MGRSRFPQRMNRQTPASCTMSPACRMNTTRSLWRHEALGRPTLLWAMDGALFFRAVPPYGERPSPHQETEAGTSARNTTRSHSNILRKGTSRKFCRLTPPAEAGSSRRQTAGGGEVNTLALNRSLRTLFIFQGTNRSGGRWNPFSYRRKYGSRERSAVFRLFHIPVEKNTNENEFHCQLKFQKNFLPREFLNRK